VKRRQFITLLGGAAAWPLAARARQDGRVRLIGWLDGYDERAITAALLGGLAKLGWIEGRNLKIERRVGAGDQNRMQGSAAELVSLTPDVIVAGGAAATRAAQRETQSIPIVFAGGGDPAATGLVKNIARPEGNVTGFSSSEPTIGSKWLELLKEAAPRISRVAIVFNPDIAPTSQKYIVAIESAADTLSVQIVKMLFRDAVDLMRSIDAFAREPNSGLLMLPPALIPDRVTILRLASQHHLPAIYPQRILAVEGGLISYNSDVADQHGRAATYVDRILRGSNVADLPVQAPTKYELVINLKTARALGLDVPPTLLARADEVIE